MTYHQAATYLAALPSLPRHMLVAVLLAGCAAGLFLVNERRSGAGAARSGRFAQAAMILPVALVAVGCVGIFVCQLRLGRWQVDEYELLATIRDTGWASFSLRLHYSPRPFSELLLHLYAIAVLHTGYALIRPFLLVLWVGTAAAIALAARHVLHRHRIAVPIATGAGLLALGLLTGPVTELFFWPMAAAAYLPTVGAAATLVFLLSDLASRRCRIGAGAALLVSAGSSEVGAALALAFAMILPLAALVWRDAAARLVWRHPAWWLLPGLAGIWVMRSILIYRAGVTELGADRSSLTGHVGGAMLQTLHILPADLLAGGADRFGGLLAAFGIVALWRAAGTPRFTVAHAALAAALVVASAFSIATALDHYGELCCERHEATRLMFGDVLALLLVLAVAGRLRLRVPLPLATLGLAAALLVPLQARWRGVHADLAQVGLAREGHDKTWASGRARGSDMTFFIPPDGNDMLVRGTFVPLRRFVIGRDTPDMPTAMGRFFDKSVVTVCQPYQTDTPLIIHGQYIAACPKALRPLLVIP